MAIEEEIQHWKAFVVDRQAKLKNNLRLSDGFMPSSSHGWKQRLQTHII